MLISSSVNLVDNEALNSVKEPDMSVFKAYDEVAAFNESILISSSVSLVDREALNAVNEPEISSAICADEDSKVLPSRVSNLLS